ncbi:hypothetical protein DYBT9623_05153 [Dyadobacter sp. CECT 9623]|uniref:Uncharacterized protein n=1 Tax=Dyadobacter linearis TaxID=2823330 RepID=A0ABN7RE91_9BACT|nr:hypothetical protein DYBT9623_05153 [Dyadobacter sp. CECT 9623]
MTQDDSNSFLICGSSDAYGRMLLSMGDQKGERRRAGSDPYSPNNALHNLAVSTYPVWSCDALNPGLLE